MNITPVEIYWLTRLDDFNALFVVVLIVLVLLTIANVAGGLISMDQANFYKSFRDTKKEKNNKACMRRRFKRAVKLGVAALLLGLGMSFMPSTKQMAAIIIIPKIANSEIVAEMGDATKELIVLARDWMRKLAPAENQKGDAE